MRHECSLSAVDSVQMSPKLTPGFIHVDGLTTDSAEVTSRLLTENHAQFHTRWKLTFHNHLTHHLLTLWALGASPSEIQAMWDYNTPYQTGIHNPDDKSEDLDLQNPRVFKQALGKNENYAEFLKFFENEIVQKGVPEVLQIYLLDGSELANDIFYRLWTDLMHPAIHLGCGLEFNQPSIIAEALAGACVHQDWARVFLEPTENCKGPQSDVTSSPFIQMLESLRNDSLIASGVKHDDPFNKIPDGLLKRVSGESFAPHLSIFQCGEEKGDLRDKMTDMFYGCVYMASAAQSPGKHEALDFVTIHSVTMAALFPAILALDWMSDHDKARLLVAKARVDGVMYAGCGVPFLYSKRVTDYIPKHPNHDWRELIKRSIVYYDEGHAVKFVRAMLSLHQWDGPPPGFPIAKTDLIKIVHMALDSIERAIEPGGSEMLVSTAKAVVKRIGLGGEMVKNNMVRWVFYNGLERPGTLYL
ncbi:hypothetical protein LX32DRAFT_587404 [Colletotrichum zoysiae]|uniref:Oxidoreductase AflY n=1 Tax=Colletotrichum zoysiae TaxID=1216348 RepID=A0AAD9HJK9_9PEZI|nr:hypothetical protein LX32DRAFT_587404 [Colletotrichum zoysiae]